MAKARKRTKNAAASNGDTEDKSVITLRIDGATRKKLHEYALRRSRDAGRNVSLNQCVIELIRHGA